MFPTISCAAAVEGNKDSRTQQKRSKKNKSAQERITTSECSAKVHQAKPCRVKAVICYARTGPARRAAPAGRRPRARAAPRVRERGWVRGAAPKPKRGARLGPARRPRWSQTPAQCLWAGAGAELARVIAHPSPRRASPAASIGYLNSPTGSNALGVNLKNSYFYSLVE